MEVICQLHTVAALHVGKGSSEPTEQGAGWVLESVRILWEEAISSLCQESDPDSPVTWPVA
jgi:hypothetical protein